MSSTLFTWRDLVNICLYYHHVIQLVRISLTLSQIRLYRPSILAGLLDYILRPHRTVIGKF